MPDIQVRDPRRDRHKRWLAAAAAVIALALAVDRLTARPSAETRFPAVRVPPPAMVAKPAPAAEVSADVDSLFKLFQEAEAVPGAAPVVEEFAKEFKQDPVLEKELKDFEEPPAPEPKEDLKAFARNLAEKTEFRALVSRFAQDPGFRQVALQLSAHPEIRDVIREVLAKAKTERASPRSSTVSLGAGLAGRRVAAPSGRGGGPGHDGGAGSTEGATALAKVLDARAGKDVARTSAATTFEAKPGAQDVPVRLATIEGAGPSNVAIQRFCQQYRNFCSGSAPTVKPQFAQVAALMDQYGLWGACFRLKLFSECANACLDGSCGTQEDGWPACSAERFGALDDLSCLGLCQLPQEQPCTIPDDVLARCSVTAAACTKAAEQSAKAKIPSQCGALGEVKLPQPCACTGAACGPTPASPAPKALVPSYWLGYNAEAGTGKLVIGPKQARTVRRMYALFIQNGGNAAAAARELNSENLNKKNGDGELVQDFTGPKIDLLLQRCVYAGGKGEALRIVGDKEFDLAQKLLRKKGAKRVPGFGCKK